MDSGSEGGKAQFNQERIESAVFFDIDDISDKNSPYDHMLPSPQAFQEHVGQVRVQLLRVVIMSTGFFSPLSRWELLITTI